MGFFLRKSFSSGPVRLNLSKGGLGLSVGVTGSRLGLNKKGAYVAGGRHGFYYRENLRKKKHRGTGSGTNQPRIAADQFMDTGLTYLEPAEKLPEPTELKTPEHPRFYDLVFRYALFSFLLMLGGLLFASYIALSSGLILMIGGFGYSGILYTKGKQAIQKTEERLERLEHSGDPEGELLKNIDLDIPAAFKNYHQYLIAEAAVSLYLDSSSGIDAEKLWNILDHLSLSEKLISDICHDAFQVLFEELVADHMISEDEEKELARIYKGLKLSGDKLQQEIKTIRAYRDFREALNAEPDSVEAPLNLTRDEKVLFTTPGRLLAERVLDSYVRAGQRYKVTGYIVDLEGSIYITSKRIVIEAESLRDYRVNKIQNVTLSLEDNTVLAELEGRKSPLILTCPNTPRLAGALRKAEVMSDM